MQNLGDVHLFPPAITQSFPQIQFGAADCVRWRELLQPQNLPRCNRCVETGSAAGEFKLLAIRLGVAVICSVLQIIVASKFWKSVHAEIYAEQIKDYVIFGAPLDIAIAANTKFDVVFINRREMSQAPKQNNKLNLVLGTFRLKIGIDGRL